MTKPPAQTYKAKSDPARLIRVAGERDEVFDIPLTELEIAEQKSIYVDLDNQKAEIEAKKKEALDGFRAQLTAIANRKKAAMDLTNKRRRSITVKIEEWLNGKNEIVRIRADTKEVIGNARKARADELQEALFKDDQKDLPEEVFGGETAEKNK